MRIVFFIRSLGTGGAERQIIYLAEGLSNQHDVTLLTFYEIPSELGLKLSNAGISHVSLRKKGRWQVLTFVFRFLVLMRNLKADVIYAFMDTASITALLSKFVRWRTKVIWGIRSSDMRLEHYSQLHKFLRFMECRLSVFSDLIISNSDAGRREAFKDGFKTRKILIVPNGIDTKTFRRYESKRRVARQKLNIPKDAFVVGIVARHDPMKGLETFIEAAQNHLHTFPNTYFVIAGYGLGHYSDFIKQLAFSRLPSTRLTWVEPITDVVSCFNTMDVFTLTSRFGEGFPNVIGEAMACELPVVSTNVGDAGLIIGKFGFIVERNCPKSIIHSWRILQEMTDSERREIGMRSRSYVEANFGLAKSIFNTEKAIRSLINASE